MNALKAFLTGDKKMIAWMGLIAIMGSIALQVKLQVDLVAYYSGFYDTIQNIVSDPTTDHSVAFWGGIALFLKIAISLMVISVVTEYGSQHYGLVMREFLHKRYTSRWEKIKDIEGIHQRVQEDLAKLADFVSTLFMPMAEALFLLIAFVPLLISHSADVPTLPWIGDVPYSLVWVCLLSSAFGTGLMYLLGKPLAGIEYENQKRESLYREQLVHSEMKGIDALWYSVKANYHVMYKAYLKFNIAKFSYIQLSVMLAYIAMSDSILSGAISFGMLIAIAKIFDRVENALLTLARNWNVVVKAISVIKRLNEVEGKL